ncbi:amidohydrolase [Candidatus Micrarchaeota archaeon]|nr:amidohydrolase [Candidatus Micrarchaeota archaeon]
MNVLIKNAIIITQNPNRDIIKGNIYIENGLIKEVGDVTYNAETEIDAMGKAVMPGLINTHTHAGMTFFRGYGEGLELHDWLEKKIWPAEAKMNEEDVYWSSKLGIAEMIRSGTTCFADMYVMMDGTARAVKDTGIRASVFSGMFDLIPGHSFDSDVKKTEEFIEKWKGINSRMDVGVAPHSLYTCSEEMLKKAKEISNKNAVKFHIHISETRKEVFDCLKETGKRPFEYADSIGLIDRNSILVHSGWVSKREIDAAGKKEASISVCPASNLKLATGGICPSMEFKEAGANVTIGTDGAASNNSLNMFESMKLAALLQKYRYWKASRISAQDVFDFATVNGAKALGTNAGSIEPEKSADLVFLDLSLPCMRPAHDIISNIVYSATPEAVSDVIVDGIMLMENRTIISFNEHEAVENAGRRVNALISS